MYLELIRKKHTIGIEIYGEYFKQHSRALSGHAVARPTNCQRSTEETGSNVLLQSCYASKHDRFLLIQQDEYPNLRLDIPQLVLIRLTSPSAIYRWRGYASRQVFSAEPGWIGAMAVLQGLVSEQINQCGWSLQLKGPAHLLKGSLLIGLGELKCFARNSFRLGEF
ncbi:hypothetical protein AVEN_255185-1 [Araneus ventricosus]|uniref:Uncharacterized protein n=1 Tax=Araneus ventricosus TaxID=182803 RepID=A0A4Y2BA01_ARAVE|nr:hypothetical protein AVEN_255185-1 [Araneus ventricosus]